MLDKTKNIPAETIPDPCHCPHCGRQITQFLPLRTILREVAKDFGLSVTELVSECREARLTFARAVFYYRALTETASSIPKIANICGDRDHTTVRNAVGMYCEMTGLPKPRFSDWTRYQKRKMRRK